MIRAMKPPSKIEVREEMPTKKYRVSPDVVKIKIDAIEVPPWARKIPREYLAESVQARGVISPIIVGRLRAGKEARFILIDGAGRLEEAKKRGEEEVPARIVDIESEEEALLLSIELEQTKEPWSLEYTLEVIQELLNRGYSKQKIAEILKIPRSKLYRLLWIMEFPEEIKEKFISGEIPLRYADEVQKIINAGKIQKLVKHFKELIELGVEPVRALKGSLEICIDAVRVEEKLKKIEKKEEVEEKKEEIAAPEEEIEEIEITEVEEGAEEKPEVISEEEMEEELRAAETFEEKLKKHPWGRLLYSAYNKLLSAIDDLKHCHTLLADGVIGKATIAAAIADLENEAEMLKSVLKDWGIEPP